MNPADWGPHAWKFLHYVCLNYPDNPSFEEREVMKNYIKYFSEVIPCSVCRSDFKKIKDEYDMNTILNSKISLFEWSVDVHNRVNTKLGKKTMTHISAFKSLTNPPRTKSITQLYILLVVCLLGYILKR